MQGTKTGRLPRVFIAVPDPGSASPVDLRRELLAMLPRSAEGLRWVRPEDSHLTLKFLGPVEEGQLRPLRIAIDTVARHCPAFCVGLRGLGGFANALWLGVGAERESLARLQSLARSIDDACAGLGFARETRAFRPHVTVARWSAAVRPDLGALRARFGARDWGVLPVTSLCLYGSDTRPEGARYTVLHKAALVGGSQ